MELIYFIQFYGVFLISMCLKEVLGDYKCTCEGKTIDCTSRMFKVLYFSDVIPETCQHNKILDLSNNKFDSPSQVFISEIMDFQSINVSMNSLITLESAFLLHVEDLDISANQIKKIELQNTFANLRTLYGSRNRLNETNGDFITGNCKIRVLDISENHLESIQSTILCNQLSHLDASFNEIQSIPKGFQNFKALVFINMSNNAIKTLSNLPATLQKANFSHNYLAQISSSSFQGLSALEELDLAHNKIEVLEKDIFEELQSLKQLDISHNLLSVIPTLELSSEVQNVILSSNKIISVDVNAVTSLTDSGGVKRDVDIRENPLAKEDPGLRELVLFLDANDGTVEVYPGCACANATLSHLTLLLCVTDQDADAPCWVDVARLTTTTTTTSTTIAPETEGVTDSSSSESSSSGSSSDVNAPNVTENNVNETLRIQAASVSEFMTYLGAAKLSFLAFLLLTLVILIVINCIVGDPVIDDRWWEETLRSDRIVT